MLDLAELKPGERLIDLGSGDGRIVLAAARRGASALGVELASDLVRRAREAARFEGLEARASFRRDDLFIVPLRGADVVTLYLLPAVNLRLRPKLLAELPPGARVVSHAFNMADWAPDGHRSVDGRNVYLWVVPATAGGRWQLTLDDGRVATLVIEQRFQKVAGTLDGEPIGGAALRGDRLRFTAGGRAFHAIVADRTLAPDPAAPAGAAAGWHADRAE
jgi:SAM-dependent methyltransferase